MATYDFDGVVFLDPEWSAFPSFVWYAGQTIDIDLRDYLDNQFDGTIARKVGSGLLPPDLAIEHNRYLRGTLAEAHTATIRFNATRYNKVVESGDFVVKVYANPLFRGKNIRPLFRGKDSRPLFRR